VILHHHPLLQILLQALLKILLKEEEERVKMIENLDKKETHLQIKEDKKEEAITESH
jgi:hypothetical protein